MKILNSSKDTDAAFEGFHVERALINVEEISSDYGTRSDIISSHLMLSKNDLKDLG